MAKEKKKKSEEEVPEETPKKGEDIPYWKLRQDAAKGAASMQRGETGEWETAEKESGAQAVREEPKPEMETISKLEQQESLEPPPSREAKEYEFERAEEDLLSGISDEDLVLLAIASASGKWSVEAPASPPKSGGAAVPPPQTRYALPSVDRINALVKERDLMSEVEKVRASAHKKGRLSALENKTLERVESWRNKEIADRRSNAARSSAGKPRVVSDALVQRVGAQHDGFRATRGATAAAAEWETVKAKYPEATKVAWNPRKLAIEMARVEAEAAAQATREATAARTQAQTTASAIKASGKAAPRITKIPMPPLSTVLGTLNMAAILGFALDFDDILRDTSAAHRFSRFQEMAARNGQSLMEHARWLAQRGKGPWIDVDGNLLPDAKQYMWD